MVIRKLKFRGYDKNSNQMYFGSPVYLYSGTKDGELDYLCEYITGSHLSKESLDQKGGYDFEIMQFTGLLDKHGKEIYEGDIVKLKHWKSDDLFDYTQPFKVLWQDGQINFKQRDFNNFIGNLVGHLEIEVIGNIYENPELL